MLIATGLDATDVAITTSFGGASLVNFEVVTYEMARVDTHAPGTYLLQPFLVSSKPSNKRPALAPASVSSRCGWPFSTV